MNLYLRFAILFDFVFSILFCLLLYKVNSTSPIDFDKDSLLNLMSNLNEIVVSLAGFILAALTIIVSFKANISTKNVDEATNGLQLLLASDAYTKIVSVFKKAIAELVMIAIVVYLVWLFKTYFTELRLAYVIVFAISGLAFAVGRSLIVLFSIINLDHSSPSEES